MIANALASRLRDPSLLPAAGYVAGEWRCDGENRFDVTNPATGEVIANLPNLGAAETAEAVDGAAIAQPLWAALTGKERSVILRRLHDLLIANVDDLAVIITSEMGKPLTEARGEVLYGASYIEWFAEEAKRIYGEIIPGHQQDKRLLVIRQPVGVVGAITPWNFPNAMLARKIAPALAVGCAVVAKPAEQTPLSAIALAALAERAGLPAGLFSVIPGVDGPAIGRELCDNPKVRKLTFTGSTEVGRILMRQGASQIKKMSMELGGNAPFIVFDDADLDVAVEGVIAAKFRNNGQTCVCANRIYVQDRIYDAFAENLAAAVAKLKVGDGFEQGAVLGPLVDAPALAKVRDHIEDALHKGAQLRAGGKKIGGLFFAPTVLTGVTSDMRLAREETFGPVAPLFRFSEEADVIGQANDTEFGLASYIFSKDLARVFRVSEALEYGMVGINTGLISTEVAPFGGIKQSGQGREGGRLGVDDYLETKYLCVSGI